MKKLPILFVLFLTPLWLMAQGNNMQHHIYEIKPGYIKKDIRKNCANEPQNFELITNSDTCDSYTFQSYFRINCHYKNDTCSRLEMIYPFDHKEIPPGSDGPYKKIKDNLWVYHDEDEGIEMKVSYDIAKDLMIVNASLIKKNN